MIQPIILLILKALEGRGAERMVATLASTYADLNYDVHVLCLEYTRDMPLDSRVHVHVVPYNQVFAEQVFAPDSEQANAYRAVAQRIDDYVLGNIGVAALILANIYKINCIMAYSQLTNIINVLHTAVSRQFQEKLVSDLQTTITHLKMVYGAHPCSCVSDGARQDLLALIGNVNKTTTIYNPCAVNDIIQAAKQPLALSQFGITYKNYMIHVASFDSMKGHHESLHAYAKTARSYPLVLVGKGRLESEIKQLAIEIGIDDCVKFLGFQANPYPLIASAALLLLTSKFEGFGYTIVEAQALGIPVISTDCPFGPRELLPRQNLVPVDDIEGLVSLMNRVMAHPQNYQVPFNQQLRPESIARQYLQFGQLID